MFYNRFYFEDYAFDDEHVYEQCESYNIHAYQLSETLVIHPADPTTDFLKGIYEGKKWDVMDDRFAGQDIVTELIETHDRIVCLGHGSPTGLFGGYDFLVHDGLVDLLKEKEMVAIWCHANQFMEKHGLNGFYSGMFISELQEAWLYGIDKTDEQAISSSNGLFAAILGKHIDSDNILENVKRDYQDDSDPVITFNRNRLYYTA